MKIIRKVNRSKYLLLLLAIAFVSVIVPQLLVHANEYIEKDRKGTIQIEVGEADKFAELKNYHIDTSIYQLATVDRSGYFTVLKEYSNLQPLLDEVRDKKQSKEWETVLQQALSEVEGQKADARVAVSGGTGQSESLATGLYLITAEPMDTEEYHYEFTAGLAALPNNEFRATGKGSDTWQYDDIEVMLKPTRIPLTGNFTITKTLQSYNPELGKPLFVFSVEAVKEEETVYSDIISLAFDNAGQKTARITGIPAGAKVTVTEVYSGAGYQITSNPVVTIDRIIANETKEVSFTNDTDGKIKYGTGIVNHFAYDGTGYTWSQIEDNTNQENGYPAVE